MAVQSQQEPEVPPTGSEQIAFFDQEIETLPREQLRAVQAERLAAMLGRVYGRNPFVTEKLDAAGLAPHDVRSTEDLTNLPFTTKDELIAAQDGAAFSRNCTFPEKAYTRVHQTSGTTGEPLRVFDTEEDWKWWARCWGFVLAGAGVSSEDRLFVPFSFGPFIGFWAAVGGAERIGALMIPGGGRTSAQRLHLMAELGATTLVCTPTYALRLIDIAREENFDLSTIKMRATVHAGEPGALVPATKARLENSWGAKAYDHAGASEVGAHSFECQTQPGSTHAIESEFIVEAIDPETGLATKGDHAELVITNLGRIGFPVIRYRTGDLVRIDNQPCPCGRTFTRFSGGVIGRVDDMVVVRGVNVFPTALEDLLLQHEALDEFRVTITRRREMAEMAIEIECHHDPSGIDTRRAVQQAVTSALGLRPEVTVVAPGTLPRFELKARRFFFE